MSWIHRDLDADQRLTILNTVINFRVSQIQYLCWVSRGLFMCAGCFCSRDLNKWGETPHLWYEVKLILLRETVTVYFESQVTRYVQFGKSRAKSGKRARLWTLKQVAYLHRKYRLLQEVWFDWCTFIFVPVLLGIWLDSWTLSCIILKPVVLLCQRSLK